MGLNLVREAGRLRSDNHPADAIPACLADEGSLHQFAESLGNAVDAKDPLTFNHSREVAFISQMLAIGLGLSANLVRIIHVAGHLHDIGKIGIPDSILQKSGRLTEPEWQWVRKHPDIGARILAPVAQFSGPEGICEIVRHHHERFDGEGYPDGLSGEEIPVGARIIAVADTLSALMQNRPYRRGTEFSQAMKEICRCSGSQFDPLVVDSLCAVQGPVAELFLR